MMGKFAKSVNGGNAEFFKTLLALARLNIFVHT